MVAGADVNVNSTSGGESPSGELYDAVTGVDNPAESHGILRVPEPWTGSWPGGRAPVVLQVLPALETGGVERGTIELALALAEAGATPLVASSGGAMTRELDRAFVKHIRLPLDTKNPLRIRRNARLLERVIRDFHVDIVHARSRAPAWSAWLACRRTGAHFMTTFHGTYNFSNRLKRWYNSIMTRGERVIAISGFIRRHVIDNYDIDPNVVRLVHRCYDPMVFEPERVSQARLIQLATRWRLPEDRPVILMPGRLTRWKGQTVVIDALARLGRRDVVCLMVGSDQGRSDFTRELEARIRRHKLEGVVHLAGQCDDMAAAYLLSTVVVSASREPEAFGRVIVEAQAMGKPVIVSRVGAVAETVAEGETGWVIPPNDPAALAAALEQALAMTAAERAAVADRCREFVGDHFTRQRMTDATLAVYAELLG